jgi:cobalt-zinc-cadmium efflux system membrane fusion protein
MAYRFDPRLRLSQRAQLKILGVAAGLVVAGGAGAWAMDKLASHGATASAEAQADVFHPTQAQWSSFRVAAVQQLPFQDEQTTDGRISTNDNRTTPVFSPYTGRVTQVFVQAGQLVKKGQPLYAIQASEYVQAQNDLSTAMAARETSAAQVKTAQADEQRLSELYKIDGASLKDLQQSQLSLATAKASQLQSETALSAVRERLRIYGEDEGRIGSLEKRAESRRIEPEAIVRAPVDGTVVTRQVEPGQFLTSAAGGGSSPVFTVSDLSTVWLVANVREADAGIVRLGDPMEVRVLAFPDKVFHARVTYIGPAVDPATRRVAVRAEIANTDGLLKPEMFADFAITTSQASTSIAAPEAAVIYEGDVAHVWLARPNGSLVLQEVRVGRSAHGYVEIVDGLRPGDRVATSGAIFIDRAVRAG